MQRRLFALPLALGLSILVAGTAFATHCGVNSKPDGAGQKVIAVVNPVTGVPTFVAGVNAAGRFTGAFADVYIDLDGTGTPSAGDCVINDTFLISMHSGAPATGQDDGGLAVIPPVLHGGDPAGSEHGVGFADLAGFCPF
jgi:hypothetical protein